MNFDDERFVKIYPRNTTNWKLLGWEGRCVLMMLLRDERSRKHEHRERFEQIEHRLEALEKWRSS